MINCGIRVETTESTWPQDFPEALHASVKKAMTEHLDKNYG
jgi:hypothetical protein